MVSEISLLLIALAKSLDLLNIVDFENIALIGFGLEQERYKDSPLGMGVNATPSVSLGECGDKEGRTLGRLQGSGGSKVDAMFRILLGL